MRSRLITFFLIAAIGAQFTALGQEAEEKGKVYYFSLKNLKSSVRQELGFSMLSHFAKSGLMAKYNAVNSGISYPQPVYNRVFGIMSLSYEPKFRLIEVGSNFSVSLDVPLTGSLSTVDLRTPTGISYSTEEVTANDINTGIYSKERSSILGFFNTEIGALLSANFFQGSTMENTKLMGLSLSGGVNFIYAPLIFNIVEEYDRSDYKGYLSWTSVVTRLGLHFGRTAFYYTIGVNPTRVLYQSDLGSSRSILTNTYNRFTISFRLGK